MTGAARVLVLALALVRAGGARADSVTAARCSRSVTWLRPRLERGDSAATWLYMAYCNLTEMTIQDFKNLPRLERITVSDNELVSINQDVLRLFVRLKWLDLYSNKLRELPVFEGLSCPALTRLDLGDNLLTAITDPITLSACVKLVSLHLENNQIEYLHPDIFSRLTELEILFLSDNKLSSIADGMFASNKKLVYLCIENNMIAHVPAGFASGLQRAGAGLERFYFHGNPWGCARLLALLADARRAGVAHYHQGRFDGARPECEHDPLPIPNATTI